MKKYLVFLTVAILLVAMTVFAVSAAEGDIDFSAGGTVSAKCVHCNGETVNWLPLTQEIVTAWAGNYDPANGTHYYVAEETISFAKTLSVSSTEKLCLHLNNKTITRGNNARAFSIDGEVSVMDHANNAGLVTCIASNSSGGSVVRVNKATGIFNLHGGTLEMRNDQAKAATSYGGNGGCVWVVEKGTFNMTGGIVRDGIALDGGNVYLREGAVFTMSGGTITGGQTVDKTTTYTSLTAEGYGGNVYVAGSAQFTMTGGTIENGYSADHGGNIYGLKSSVISITGGTITNGEAVNYGGNLCAYGQVTLGACTISNGKAQSGGNVICAAKLTIDGATLLGGEAEHGGSLYINSGCTATVNATIEGGKATDRGGNIYTSSLNSNITITGGTITGGTCSAKGGNIYANNGYVTITGGTISNGKGTGGGNIFVTVGNADAEKYPATLKNYVRICDDGDPNTPAPVITGGISTGSANGGNILVDGIFELGNCVVDNGSNTQDTGANIYVGASGRIKVMKEFAGESDIAFLLSHFADGVNSSSMNTATCSAEGSFTGKLHVESVKGKPFLFGKDGDTTLYVATSSAIGEDGSVTFYEDNAQLVAKATDAAYLRPAAGALTLTGGDYVVDLCGRELQISGTGSVICFDSANDNFKTFGSATVSGVTLKNDYMTKVNGTNYIVLEDNGAYTFHRLDLKLSGVTVRTTNGGIYYSGTWSCDPVLADKVQNFGVAVSTKKAPGSDFATNSTCLYTSFDKAELKNGAVKNGVLIEDIVKDAQSGADADRIAKNASYAKKKVYAAAYITLDGKTLLSDGAAISLHDIVSHIDENIVTYAADAQMMRDFVKHWSANGLEGADWNFAFDVSEDIVALQTAYKGTVAYHGEFHDHSKTGKNGDGKMTLSQWKEGMADLNMDFAALVDHRQIEHMYDENWDPNLFIGGSEAAAMIKELESGKNKIHINMIFADGEGLKNTVENFAPYRYKDGYFSYPYDSNAISRAQIVELIELIKENGGMFVQVHPKSSGYIDSEDPLDYWFADWTGLEVFYGYSGYAPKMSVNKKNYQLWTDLLALGKKVWATAGADQHKAPVTTALTTIYATEGNANTWLNQAKVGNMVCGPVGIRMCVGDTVMGSQTTFTGKRLAISVGDIHESAYDPTHTYEMKVLDDTGVIYTQAVDLMETTYYTMDASETAKFYRVEIFDTTADLRIAIGNPIWNEKF